MKSKVYCTDKITSQGLMAVYKALGVTLQGKAAVKLSTGEPDCGKAALIERMESRNGIHTVETAAALGLGSRKYEIITIN